MRYDEISREAFRLYFAVTGSHEELFSSKNIYSMRMMYMAETASDSIRLLASHICTMSALSLCRDRYEYAARFSYLAHKKEQKEWFYYLADYFYKQHKIAWWLEQIPILKQIYSESMVDTHKEQHYRASGRSAQAFAQTWARLKLDRLVKERDRIVSETPNLPDFLKYQYYPLYAGIYVEYSSIAHMDVHALSFIKVHELGDGRRILAPDTVWPRLIVSQCAVLDILQCAECVSRFFDQLAVHEPQVARPVTMLR